MKTSICYAHAQFWGNPSVFGHKIAEINAKTTYDKIFDCISWKFETIYKNKNTAVEFVIKN